MNYEEFYEELQPYQKSLKDGLSSLQKLFKAVVREAEGGDGGGGVRSRIFSGGYEGDGGRKAYFESGQFAEQMLAACEEKGVDVQGEFPVYEMFPYRVKLDAENQELYLDRKKVQCMRPESFVDMVKSGQEKLNKVSFNAVIFAGELSDAYDLAALKLKKNPGSGIYLTSLYKLLAPMSRYRKDYDQQSFAFDLARLYSGIEETKSGRRFQFGSSRNVNKAIRILDETGQERFLTTICFYE